MKTSPLRGFTLFLTGLAGAGKTTIAQRVNELLLDEYWRTVTILDGEVVREMVSSGLTFSRADRELNIRRIGYVAGEITRHGGICIAAAIAPFRVARADVRARIGALGAYYEIHVATPLAECEKRDPKGLYRMARQGLVKNVPGVDAVYEEPEKPELRIDTSFLSVEEEARQVLQLPVRDGLL
ncbi:MAG: adenylyl-sulfate kinase [Nevskia sp.]|nr:adenylyl-sulfate kinase [Nevskia sp.]